MGGVSALVTSHSATAVHAFDIGVVRSKIFRPFFLSFAASLGLKPAVRCTFPCLADALWVFDLTLPRSIEFESAFEFLQLRLNLLRNNRTTLYPGSVG